MTAPRTGRTAQDGPSRDAVRALLDTVAGSLHDEGGIVVLLQRAAEVAREQVPGVDGAGTTIHMAGLTYTASWTDECTLAIDREQYDAGDGPCLSAARENRTVLVDVDGEHDGTADDDPWPRFSAAARREGFRSFLAAPLSVGDTAVGALNLYGRAGHAFDARDAGFVESLCGAVSRVLTDFTALSDAERAARTIRDALGSRAPIEQAKGMLMAVHRIDADAAFAMLCRQSQDTNRKLAVVAAELVEQLSGGETPAGGTS